MVLDRRIYAKLIKNKIEIKYSLLGKRLASQWLLLALHFCLDSITVRPSGAIITTVSTVGLSPDSSHPGLPP